MLVQCWASVANVGLSLKQRWVSVQPTCRPTVHTLDISLFTSHNSCTDHCLMTTERQLILYRHDFKAFKLCHMLSGPRVVVSTAAFHARVRGSVPGLGGLKETKMFPPHPLVKLSIVGSLRDREVACSASDRQGSNFESCVWRIVPSPPSHHPQEVLLAQFSLYVHKGGLKPDSFHFSFHVLHILVQNSVCAL